MSGPLSHITVLDLTRVLAGPWATQTLADLGATVIKIEKPGTGDDTRAWGPPFVKDANGRDIPGMSAYYTCANRGKLSAAIDIATEEGAQLVRDLAARCDVIVENFKTGGLARYGLDYDSVRAVNPAIVYCSITGFGHTGPYAHRAGYDVMIQGLGGMMSLTGEPEGQPMKTGVALTDIITGLYATIAVVAALPHAKATGMGQHIDMALLDVQVAALANQAAFYLVSGQVPPRTGNGHPAIVPYQVFEAADGHLVVNVGNDDQFASFCGVIGKPEWTSDARYRTNPARVENRVALCSAIGDILVTRHVSDWLPRLEAAGVPAAPINTMDRVFADTQVAARGLAMRFPAEAATIPGVRSPIRYSGFETTAKAAPPALGQHTAEVLSGVLGLPADTIAELKRRGIVSS